MVRPSVGVTAPPGAAFGAGSQLPLPLRPAWDSYAGRRGAGVPARGPTYVPETVQDAGRGDELPQRRPNGLNLGLTRRQLRRLREILAFCLNHGPDDPKGELVEVRFLKGQSLRVHCPSELARRGRSVELNLLAHDLLAEEDD